MKGRTLDPGRVDRLEPARAAAGRIRAAGLLNDTQQLGLRLFTQSCAVCHTKPTLTSGVFGPVLSKDSAGGRDDVMRDVISNGTPRMPGFKYQFTPPEIAAVVAYLMTVPAPPAPR